MDELIPLARVLFLGFLFSAFGTVQRAYLFGHLQVRQMSICSLTAMLLSSIVGVVMAMNDFAYWAHTDNGLVFLTLETNGPCNSKFKIQNSKFRR